MIPIHSSYRIKRKNINILTMSKSPFYRAGYLIIFAALFITIILNFNPETDLKGERLLGTVIFFILTLVALLAFCWTRYIDFYIKEKKVVFQSGLFGWFMYGFSWEHILCRTISPVNAIILRQINLLHSGSMQTTKTNTGYTGRLRKRAVLFRLFLQVSGKNYFLEESSKRDDLEIIGTTIADYMKIPFKTEEI